MKGLEREFLPATTAPSGNHQSSRIDCDNPMDPRSAADAIIKAVVESQKHNAETPIVVLIGDSHAFASHKALAQIVIGQLAQIYRHKLQVFYEIGKNHLEFSIANFTELETPDALQNKLHLFDCYNASLLHYLAYFTTISAPESNANLMRFCLQNNISSHFNDAMVKHIQGMSFLDPDDPDLDWGERPKPSGDDISDHVAFSSPVGVRMRNQVMVKRALEASQMEPGRVIVQLCGQNHVFGVSTETDDKPYADSLCALYRKAGACVIPVMPIGPLKPEMLPKDTCLKDTVLIEGLSDHEFFTEATAAEVGTTFIPDAEKTFMEQVSHVTDGAYAFIPADPLICEKALKASIALLEYAQQQISLNEQSHPAPQ